ncbi:MAG: hypothetical protein AAFO94_05880 [Bacteroidota bacterium]
MKSLQCLFALLTIAIVALSVIAFRQAPDLPTQYETLVDRLQQKHNYSQHTDVLAHYPLLDSLQHKIKLLQHYQNTLHSADRSPLPKSKAESEQLQKTRAALRQLKATIPALLRQVGEAERLVWIE